jgi:ElaB/YqjD/DUF883 family membrane-anchored ribosome-binding protein
MMITDQVAEEQRSPPHSQQAQQGLAEAYAKVTDLEQQARALIRQRPVVAVLAAAGIGYLVARLVSRATR